MKRIKEDLEDIEFIRLDNLLLPDNNEVRKTKSLFNKEVDYFLFLGPIEFFIANYGIWNPELQDKDLVRMLQNIRNNFDKELSFFKEDLERQLMCTISASLQISEKKITKHELSLVIKHILWSIDNRRWLNDSRAYFNWIANFFHLFDKKQKKKFDKKYENAGEELGIGNEEIKNLKEEYTDFEPPVNQIALSKLDSENFEEDETIWSENSYMESMSTSDPDIEERLKYFNEASDKGEKNFKCEKCGKAIGKHNLYWHEGMCNECFFNTYNM